MRVRGKERGVQGGQNFTFFHGSSIFTGFYAANPEKQTRYFRFYPAILGEILPTHNRLTGYEIFIVEYCPQYLDNTV